MKEKLIELKEQYETLAKQDLSVHKGVDCYNRSTKYLVYSGNNYNKWIENVKDTFEKHFKYVEYYNNIIDNCNN